MTEWLVSAGLLALAALALAWAVRAILRSGATRLRAAVVAAALVLGLVVFVTWSYEVPFLLRTPLALALAGLTLATSLRRRPPKRPA
ncbi:MAG TPA: hypothetical protein VIO14_08785 [Dehalococcoidia bacterium]